MKAWALLFFLFTVGHCGQFDEALNWYMMQHASAAYCHPPDIPLWNCTAHCVGTFKVTSMMNDSSDNTLGYVGYDDEKKINLIAFRGTESRSLINWIEDLDFAKMINYDNDTNASVHRGFYRDYTDMKDQLFAAVTEVTDARPDYKIYVVGHSLGSALATLAAVDIVDAFAFNVTVFDFGGPRIGNQGFVNYARQRLPEVYRVVNQRDIVPHLPPRWLDFAHLPTEVWYWKSKFTECDPNNGEDPECSNSLFLNFSIEDHIYYPNVTMGHHTC